MPIIPANGIENAITIAVLIIGFIGWLVQMAGQNKAAQPPVNRPRPAAPPGNRPDVPRDKSLQSEIDAFLREVGSSRKPVPKDDDVAIEILDDDEPPNRRLTAPSRSETFAPAAPAARTSETRLESARTTAARDAEQQRLGERLVSMVADRHLESAALGAEMRQHVEQSMAESNRLRREKEQVERSLADANAQLRALRDGSTSNPQSVPAGLRSGARPSVLALIRDKRTVKDAIIVKEILEKPRGLRSSHR